MRDSDGLTGAGGAAEWPEGGGSEPLTVVDGRYAIERELGRGGSAVVYLARDVRDDSRVALKLLHQEFSGSKAAERFSLEVRLLREFEHPAILSVTDAGEWQGRPFYVMPFVDGESLQDRLRRERRLPFVEVVRIGRRLCDALAYAHERKVVHRDVKPANVMLAGDAVYLTDFGVAKALEPVEGAPHSTTGVARGTRAYMSPEQLTADRDLDQRSDIFSLGCVLYEMIAGVRPYASADEGRELMRRLVEAPDPLKRHRDGVPPGLESVVMKALAREPADRWQWVGEVGRGLGGSERRKPGNWPAPAVVAVLVMLALIPLVLRSREGGIHRRARVDPIDWISSRLMVVPVVEPDAGASEWTAARAVANTLRAALFSQHGVPLVELPSDAERELRTRTWALDRARAEGIRVLVTVGLQLSRDSVQTTVTLIDTAADSVIRAERHAFRFEDLGTEQVGSLLRTAVLRRTSQTTIPDVPELSVDYRAMRLLQEAIVQIDAWQPDSARAVLRKAIEFAPRFARAHQLSAELTFWTSAGAVSIREQAARASALARPADTASILMTTALDALGREDFARACRDFQRLTEREPSSFEAWFSLAECRRRDPVVLPNVTRPGSWRFRSDLRDAEAAYRRALPLAQRGLTDLTYQRMLSTLYVNGGVARAGRSERSVDDRFAALPALRDGVVVFEPLPLSTFAQAATGSVPATLYAALEHERRKRRALTAAWAEAAPANPIALTQHALAIEAMGEAPLDSLREGEAVVLRERASALMADSLQQLRNFNALVRLELKQSHFLHAARIADSLLAAHPRAIGVGAALLAPLAAILGRPSLTAALLAAADVVDEPSIQWSAAHRDPLLRTLLSELAARTALGECSDSLRTLWGRVDTIARAIADSATASRAVAQALERASLLYVPCDSGRALRAFARSDNPTELILRAASSGDTAAVERLFHSAAKVRIGASAAEVAWDARFLEAWALARVGFVKLARLHVDQGLLALPRAGEVLTEDVSEAASFVSAIKLRVSLSPDEVEQRRWMRELSKLRVSVTDWHEQT